MKLRLLGNSIRLRLTQSEVGRVGQGDTVVEATTFADGARFEFALGPHESAGDPGQVTARFDSGRLTVSAPRALLASWAATDRVALAAPDENASPRVLVEKDFNCLVPRDGDDDADTFPHPKQDTERC
ncbi:MAG: hypothetical protein AAGD86_01440 [Pseudomonadota bacterium]